MSFKPLVLLKKHPYMVAGGVFVVGVILVIVLTGGSEDTGTTVINAAPDTSGDVAANASMYQAQLGANVANTQTAAQQTVALDTNATTYKLAQLSADTQQNANIIGGVVSLQKIKSDAASLDLQTNSTLAAIEDTNRTQYAMLNNNNATQYANNVLAAQVQTTNILSQERVNAAQIGAQTQVQLGSILSSERTAANANATLLAGQGSTERIAANATATALEQSRLLAGINAQLLQRAS